MATIGLNDAPVTFICDDTQAKFLLPEIKAFLERHKGIGCVLGAEGFTPGAQGHSRQIHPPSK